MGVGVDQSPHYYLKLHNYRQTNPDSVVGLPGKMQVKS